MPAVHTHSREQVPWICNSRILHAQGRFWAAAGTIASMAPIDTRAHRPRDLVSAALSVTAPLRKAGDVLICEAPVDLAGVRVCRGAPGERQHLRDGLSTPSAPRPPPSALRAPAGLSKLADLALLMFQTSRSAPIPSHGPTTSATQLLASMPMRILARDSLERMPPRNTKAIGQTWTVWDKALGFPISPLSTSPSCTSHFLSYVRLTSAYFNIARLPSISRCS